MNNTECAAEKQIHFMKNKDKSETWDDLFHHNNLSCWVFWRQLCFSPRAESIHRPQRVAGFTGVRWEVNRAAPPAGERTPALSCTICTAQKSKRGKYPDLSGNVRILFSNGWNWWVSLLTSCLLCVLVIDCVTGQRAVCVFYLGFELRERQEGLCLYHWGSRWARWMSDV